MSELSAQYARDGFVLLRGVLVGAQLQAVCAELDRAFAQQPREDLPADEPIMVCWRHHRDGQRTVLRLAELSSVEALTRAPAVLARAAELGEAQCLQRFEVIAFDKPPGVGERFAWHNDASFYPFEPARLVSLWIALDDCTPASGSLTLARGSHRFGPVAPVHVKTGASLVADPVDALPESPASHGFEPVDTSLSPGDAVAFDGYTWHSSRPNTGPHRRRGLCIRYLTEPVRYAPRPGVGGTFARQLGMSPGALVDSPAFPVLWSRP